ncbi:hypothetical protein [Crinalium epipsammum]|nr:hypothetical protein [Crinalium epipsammum]
MASLDEEPEESQGNISRDTPDCIVKPKWHLTLLAGTWAGLVQDVRGDFWEDLFDS